MNLPSSLTKNLDPRLLDLFQKKHTGDQDDSNHDGQRATLHKDVTNGENMQTSASFINDGNTSNHDPIRPRQPVSRLSRWSKNTAIVLKRHCAFIGPGIVASVGYTDPGNW